MNHLTQNNVNKKAIAKAFGLAAKSYDSVAVLQREIGHRLLERLSQIQEGEDILVRLENLKTILDLGGGTGFCSRLLATKFPKAQVCNLDLAFEMLEVAKLLDESKNELKESSNNDLSQFSYVSADAEKLPFTSATLDLIFSNCTVQWCRDLPQLFQELRRVLKPQGLLLFSTFGPDTLYELKECFNTVDTDHHVNNFFDMHHLGDVMLKSQFKYPVVDREMITVTYVSVQELLKDLKLMGASHVFRESGAGLLTQQKLKKLIASYEKYRNTEGFLTATFEVIFGCAFAFDDQAR